MQYLLSLQRKATLSSEAIEKRQRDILKDDSKNKIKTPLWLKKMQWYEKTLDGKNVVTTAMHKGLRAVPHEEFIKIYKRKKIKTQ